MRRSSMNTRSPDTSRSCAAAAAAACAVSRLDLQVELERQTGEAQDAQRIVGERPLGGHAQTARRQISKSTEGI